MTSDFSKTFTKWTNAGLLALGALNQPALAVANHDGTIQDFSHVQGLTTEELSAAAQHHRIVTQTALEIQDKYVFAQQIEDLMEGRTLENFIEGLDPSQDYSESAILGLMEEAAHTMLNELDGRSSYKSKTYTPENKGDLWDNQTDIEASVINGNIAVFQIGDITTETDDQIRQAYKNIIAEYGDNISSVIIDLRDSGGGNNPAAYQIIDDFSTDEKIGSFEVNNPKVAAGLATEHTVSHEEGNRFSVQGSESQITDLPLAILVSYKTASSAELIAGSLQEMGRAVVIGNSTYGKATSQGTVNLSQFAENEASLAVTTGLLNLPVSDQTYQAVGITPDIRVTVNGVNFSDRIDNYQDKHVQKNGERAWVHVSERDNHIQNPDGYSPNQAMLVCNVDSSAEVNVQKHNISDNVTSIVNMSNESELYCAGQYLQAQAQQGTDNDDTKPGSNNSDPSP